MTRFDRTLVSTVFSARIFVGCVLVGILFATLSVHASTSAVYVGQTASGSADGSSCANQLSAAFFNLASNWGSGGTQIGPGTTVHLCGTITTPLVAQGNGAASNPVTLVWESGASLNICNTAGAVQLGSRGYFLLDLGGNATAIQCPNNGTGLGGSVNAVGISMNSPTNIEIRNGTIGPLYQYSGTGSDGLGSVCVKAGAPSNIYYHDLSLKWCNQGFFVSLSGTTSGNVIAYNTTDSTVGRAVLYANGTGSGKDTGTLIHDNDFTLGDAWYSGPTDATHLEMIHTFHYGGSGATDSISGMLIYNNYFHGTSRGDSTTFVFVEAGIGCPSTNSSWSGKIFNNVFVLGGTSTSAPGDGLLFVQNCNENVEIYNNTLDAGSNGHSVGAICMEFEGSNTITMKNNICMNANTMVYNADATPGLSADYNIYYNVGTSGANGWYWGGKGYTSLANWTGATGNDSHSATSNPGLNSDYTISTGAAASGIATNLTSLGVTQLDSSKPTNVGPGNDSAAGVPRPGSGNWDLGAYAVGNGTLPAPPTGLAASVL